MGTSFTHLHVHSGYSLLDGSANIKELIQRTKELGMDSMAITDHGVMFGVIDFYKEAKEHGIKPIIGCEVYVAHRTRFDKEKVDSRSTHLVLLAENMTGYENLIKMVSAGHIEGFYRRPRIDFDLLREHSEGIIGLSACLGGGVSRLLLQEQYEQAKEVALLYDEILGRDNFYLEMQDHGLSAQKTVNQQMLRLSKETGIPLVVTNDIHYIYPEDAEAHEILLCIQTGKTIDDPTRMIYEGGQFFVKSPEEMEKIFPYAKEALANTSKIAERCNLDFTFNELKLPEYDVPEGYSAAEYLKKLCYEGLEKRYHKVTKELEERLEYELGVIIQMGFVDYFLIVWDFIKYAKDNNIPVGPGRGSAAGSIVAYTLAITNIDPIKYQLIFERFLNPERVSMPDIDIDFCYERRQEVIDYVIEKYGSERVAQIITFGTMAARAVIRDVGRATNMPYADVDAIAKMIPLELKITIKKALTMNSELKQLYDTNPDVKYLIDMSMRLEGLPRHASTHAAGVVISKKPVVEYVPLNSNDGVITTQFTMTTLEELGLLKMDFLGLRTLTVIQNALDLIEINHNICIDIDKIPLDDQDVFKLISSSNTEGIFQLESAGMKSFMRELQPGSLDDIIAGVALYRPGPMDFIPKYIRGKNDQESITYTHPSLEPILEETYGCIVYQEQVMQIVRDLGGYSLGRSDLLRRVMSKKKEDIMEKERKIFIHGGDGIRGCVKNGIPAEVANKIFDEMTDFAKYAFNKSHAAAYAVIAYQTAWLKTHYPVEFMAALMTSIMGNTDKIKEYMDSCKRMGLEVISPDINEGYGFFSTSDNKIRYGLAAIKNVGVKMINAMVEEREANGAYNSLTDFYTRMESKDTSKRAIESLISAGAFDSLGGKRNQYHAVYKQIADGITHSRKKNIEGQINIFSFGAEEDEVKNEDVLPDMEEYPQKVLLTLEKEILGIYLSGHPLAEYAEKLRTQTSANSKDFRLPEDIEEERPLKDGQMAKIGGIIVQKKIVTTRNNKTMAFVTLEDVLGTIEVIVFPNIYEKGAHYFDEDNIVLIEGRITLKEEEDAKIICEKVIGMEEFGQSIILKLSEEKRTKDIRNKLLYIFGNYKGNATVIVESLETGELKPFPSRYNVQINGRIIHDLSLLLGKECVVVPKSD
ncbi:MAG TPA: DNA polymerase III subunit alpha [Epulopiscium sp.]|nr:DNA polymerase III subunit alpha [Candidatus Epulonipiscium sp.]